MSLIDLTGRRFGRLVVAERAPDSIQENGRHRIMWKCQCDCGNSVICYGDNLKLGVTQSCGCYRKDCALRNNSTHRESKTLLYGIWCGMKARCNNRNTTAYMDYGGRNINICPEWNDSYEAFAAWARANGYMRGLSIERTDNDGDYCPENCKWVGRVAQANNRRSNIVLDYHGQSHTLTEWSHIVGINAKTLMSRYHSGWSTEKILTTPLMLNGTTFKNTET